MPANCCSPSFLQLGNVPGCRRQGLLAPATQPAFLSLQKNQTGALSVQREQLEELILCSVMNDYAQNCSGKERLHAIVQSHPDWESFSGALASSQESLSAPGHAAGWGGHESLLKSGRC